MSLRAQQDIYPGDLESVFMAQLEKARKTNLVGEIIAKNPAVFRKKEKSHQKIILNRLGWMDSVGEMPAEIERIENLVESVRKDGFRHLFVLGMGGSSLCPEVFGNIFGKKSWLKSYTIIDTTAPSRLQEIMETTDFSKAFFIVSSKSGATIETVSHFRFFFRMMKELRPLKAGRFFAAITDEGSELHRIGRRNRFREVFLNRSDIGGRYSALSFFGLVPGAFTRLDLRKLLAGAQEQLEFMIENGNDCDALQLGTLMGIGAVKGLDKLRFQATGAVAPLVTWIEQLVAESTGKEKKGVIPIEGAVNGGPALSDVVDIYYSVGNDKGYDAKTSPSNSQPRVSIHMPDPIGIGAEMLKWEMATAVASTVLGVNPFDEPNVAESKKNTAAILHARRGPRKIIPIIPVATYGQADILDISNVAGLERRRQVTAQEAFSGFFAGMAAGDYLSLLSYTEMNDGIEKRLSQLRQELEKVFPIVTMRGYGPRFLHSTGQLFKGGTQKGHFIVFEREYDADYDIPSLNISFGRLIKAQGNGDIKALQKRKRPLIHINLRNNPEAGLDSLIELVKALPR